MQRALALRDVMEHAVRVQREITGPSVIRRSRARAVWTAIVCVPLIGACVYSWVARPTLIWGPREFTESTAREEADVRLMMFLLAQRIEAVRAAEGAYPGSLAAIADVPPGISYDIVSDSGFELRAAERGHPIVFRSNEDVDAFLGNSLTLITGHER